MTTFGFFWHAILGLSQALAYCIESELQQQQISGSFFPWESHGVFSERIACIRRLLRGVHVRSNEFSVSFLRWGEQPLGGLPSAFASSNTFGRLGKNPGSNECSVLSALRKAILFPRHSTRAMDFERAIQRGCKNNEFRFPQ